MRKNVQSPSNTSCRIGINASTTTITSTTTTCTRNLSFSVSSHCNCFSKRTRLAFCCQHRVTVSSSTETPEHKHAACVRVEQQGSLESLWITHKTHSSRQSMQRWLRNITCCSITRARSCSDSVTSIARRHRARALQATGASSSSLLLLIVAVALAAACCFRLCSICLPTSFPLALP